MELKNCDIRMILEEPDRVSMGTFNYAALCMAFGGGIADENLRENPEPDRDGNIIASVNKRYNNSMFRYVDACRGDSEQSDDDYILSLTNSFKRHYPNVEVKKVTGMEVCRDGALNVRISFSKPEVV